MQHFTPFSWITLSIFTGVMAGFGQILAKDSGQAGMPPYVLIGIVGVMWAGSSLVFMALGPGLTKAGLPPIMSFAQVARLGTWVLAAVVLAGFIFWVENLSRFDAINKAPFITYVLVVVELSAGISALVVEVTVRWWQGRPISFSIYEMGGVLLAAASIALFAMSPARAP